MFTHTLNLQRQYGWGCSIPIFRFKLFKFKVSLTLIRLKDERSLKWVSIRTFNKGFHFHLPRFNIYFNIVLK